MDLEVRQSLHDTIEKLTHAGTPSLDQKLLKKVKTLCRQYSDPCIRAAYQRLTLDLSEDHAEVRLSAFQVIKELFTRSNLFRELLITDFKTFSGHVTGTDLLAPLPPPKDAAEKLKKTSLLAIRDWNERYGKGYPKLRLGYNYLKFNRKVDFVRLVAEGEVERRRKEEREVRKRTILQQRIQEVKQEMLSLRQEVDASLTEVDACFNLILPRFEMPDMYTCAGQTSAESAPHKALPISVDQVMATQRKRTESACSFASLSEGSGTCEEGSGFSINDFKAELIPSLSRSGGVGGDSDGGGDGDGGGGDDEISSSDSDSSVEWEDVSEGVVSCDMELQEHGMLAHGFSISLEVSRRVEVRETEDNSSILATLEERRKQLTQHHLPSLSKCLEWMVKAGEQDNVLEAIDLKARISAVLAKYNKLDIIFKNRPPDKKELSGSHAEIKGRVPVPTVTDPEWRFGGSISESNDAELDPTTLQAQLAKLKKKKKPLSSPSSLRKKVGEVTSDLLSLAPVVPFGMDLYHWEEPSTSVEPRTLATIGSLHRFWAEEKEVHISKDEQDRLKCRTISFPGQFKPVLTACRARLHNGKLCPRKDRYKCPFHGLIVPRDEHGDPLREQGPHPSPHPSPHPPPSPPLWQDQALQEAVMDAKGIDLHTSKKGKKGKKKYALKYPGLTNLTVTKETPRKRLEKKVLSKHSLKRVAQGEERLTEKKFSDKFGNNFNYALKK